MSPDELRKLMHRYRVSSAKLGKAIGVHPVTVRRWRNGARHPGRGEAQRIIVFFRDLGGEPTPTIDPAEIAPAPIEHRITIVTREEPLPQANRAVPAKAGIVEAINNLAAVVLALRPRADPMPRPAPASTARPQPLSLFRRDDHRHLDRPIPRAPASQPQLIDT